MVSLHYIWLAHSLYATIPWLDIPAHAVSSAGVVGILILGLRETFPDYISNWWVITMVLAIGAGFEIYEFLVKTFWYHWTLTTYLEDTVLDLLIEMLSAGIIVHLSSSLKRQRRYTPPSMYPRNR